MEFDPAYWQPVPRQGVALLAPEGGRKLSFGRTEARLGTDAAPANRPAARPLHVRTPDAYRPAA